MDCHFDIAGPIILDDTAHYYGKPIGRVQNADRHDYFITPSPHHNLNFSLTILVSREHPEGAEYNLSIGYSDPPPSNGHLVSELSHLVGCEIDWEIVVGIPNLHFQETISRGIGSCGEFNQAYVGVVQVQEGVPCLDIDGPYP